MLKRMNRREFFVNTGISTTGIVLGSYMSGCSPAKKQDSSYDLMDEVMKFRKIDAHAHVHLFHGGPEAQIEYADRLGIDKLIISRPIIRGNGTPEEFRESNNIIIESVRQFPDRLIGQFTLVPTFQKESLEEIDRCVDLGLVGLKAYTQVKINDPLFYPIVEKCIDHKMIVFLHAECQLGVGGYRMKYDIKTASGRFNTGRFCRYRKTVSRGNISMGSYRGEAETGNICAKLYRIVQMFMLIRPAAITKRM